MRAEAENTLLFKTGEDDKMKHQKLVSLDKLARVWSKSFQKSLPGTQRIYTGCSKGQVIFICNFITFVLRVLSLKKPEHLHRSWVTVLLSDFI